MTRRVEADDAQILICLDAAVIVIGSRGLGGLRDLTRGSVSRDVATHARRPVLIVPPPHSKGAV